MGIKVFENSDKISTITLKKDYKYSTFYEMEIDKLREGECGSTEKSVYYSYDDKTQTMIIYGNGSIYNYES